jgi:hypothetical protein
MISEGLVISWQHSTEYVPFDSANLSPNTTVARTYELRKPDVGGELVTYVVRSVVSIVGDDVELCLKYQEEDQLTHITDVFWGASVIRWRLGDREGSVDWLGESPPGFNTASVNVRYRDGAPQRTRAPASKVTRPLQHALREHLLRLDVRCVISGESQPDALEAAHIQAVESDGDEFFDNAILLRADLHRLLDAGILHFIVGSDSATVEFAREVSPGYDALRGAKLPDDTFQRVAPALRRTHS